jgi:hypothetical protein
MFFENFFIWFWTFAPLPLKKICSFSHFFIRSLILEEFAVLEFSAYSCQVYSCQIFSPILWDAFHSGGHYFCCYDVVLCMQISSFSCNVCKGVIFSPLYVSSTHYCSPFPLNYS